MSKYLDEKGLKKLLETIKIPKSGGTSNYNVSNRTESTYTINPNTFYVWGTMTSLNITLGTATSGIVNEYCFQFTSGSTATELTLPSTIKWVQTPTVEANKTYQVSIINNIGVIIGA